ncbi:MAG TPA: poly-gamma-glutamate hydrolase family protein [Steroidobacteraceae bacterium]|nr:poly-gamma-glutamate hydrolase family protein [Steroidobacteraceae bacterium]
MTKYSSFAELARHEAVGKDFRVRLLERADSPVVIVAPHGGMIEVGTSEIAGLIAGTDYSLFCFEGLKSHGQNRDLHITSHCFDHPECLALAARREIVLSVHGCMGRAQIFVGGLDVELTERLSNELDVAGFTVVSDGHKYPGRHPLNICNRGLRRKGAQLEITYDLRAAEYRATIARSARAAIAGFTESLVRTQR